MHLLAQTFFLWSSQEVTENKAFKGATKNPSSGSLCHTKDLLRDYPTLQVLVLIR